MMLNNSSCIYKIMMLLVIVTIVQSGNLIAQSGTITEPVNVSEAEELLVTTSISFDEISLNATTDNDLLVASDTEGDEIFTINRFRDYSRVQNRQIRSINKSYSLTAEQINRFADYTAKEAIARIPGIQISSNRDVNIRGVGNNMYQVTVDGQRMGSTGIGSRSFDLGSISVDLIEDIQLITVLTPDMDAEAIAGVVNINTVRPYSNNRELDVRFDGGANTRYYDNTGINSRAAIRFADSPNEKFSYTLKISHQQAQHPMESLMLEYDTFEFDNELVDVLERVSPSFHTDEHNRLDAGIHFYYQPTNRTTIGFRGLYINDSREFTQHGISWAAGGDWITPDTTGATGSQGRYDYSTSLRNTEIQHYSLQVNAKHDFDIFDIEYNLGWAQGNFEQQSDLFPFQLTGLNYDINWDDRSRPYMTVTNLPLQHDSSIDPLRIGFQDIDRVFDNHIDNKYSGRVDAEVPFSLGRFKIGSSALLTAKNGDFSDARYNYLRARNLHQFKLIRDGRYRVFDKEEYYIPQFADPHAARMFYYGNRPIFNLNQSRFHERTHIRNYTASENIYATYGMTTLELYNFTFLLGLRLEHTDSKYEGRKVEFDDIGTFLAFNDTSQVNSYTNFFPNVQLAYNLGDHTKLRISYSESISRPDFNILAPYELTHAQDSTIFRGNPNLNPMIANNVDFSAEHYTRDYGYFSTGVFYKRLTDFVYQEQREIESGEFEGWSEQSYVNGYEAEVYGLEVAWHHKLAFLPSFLSNLETFANYTWTHSVYNVDYREDEVFLPGQSPHVVNVALGYSQNRFTSQVSYHWSAPSVYKLADSRQVAPAISPTNMIYMDSYQDGWKDLSASIGFRISDNFRLWANASNLLSTDRIRYDDNREQYPRVIDYKGGFEFRMGIRYNL